MFDPTNYKWAMTNWRYPQMIALPFVLMPFKYEKTNALDNCTLKILCSSNPI